MKTGIAFSLAAATTLLATPLLAATTEGIPQFDHQIVIMMENHSYSQIIGSPNTPYINQLANTYNLETNYFGTTHPSLPNYLSLIGGSNFGIGATPSGPNGEFPDPNGGNDNPPYFSQGTPGAPTTCTPTTCNPTINSPSIVDQLIAKGLTWKTYQENLPSPGSNYANSTTNGVNDKLYAVKHDPFAYFATVQNDPNQLKNLVPTTQLTSDLANGNLPNFSFIAPNQCHDMHGDPAGGCAYGNAGTDPVPDAAEVSLLQAGDNEVKSLVTAIQSSSIWSKGNNVIYLLWDENDYGTDSNQVPLIAITNNGPTGIKDNTLSNHYSLLRTIEDGFGINSYLNNAQTAQPLNFLVTGQQAVPEPANILSVGLAGIMGILLKRVTSKKR